jgi:DegV family protein with EDD domain
MSIKIVTDSTCDLPPELVLEHQITVMPLYIHFGEQGYMDGVEITRQEFYERLPDYDPPPTTATPGIDAFLEAYERIADEGAKEILSIHISEKLSATIDVARTAAQQFKRIPVTVLDSMQISLGTGFVVLEAARSIAEGLHLKDILSKLEALHPRVFVFAALDTLEFLRRSGRMNGVVAGIGGALQLKPILKMNLGDPTSDRVRTKERAIQRLINLLNGVGSLEKLALVHTNAPQAADQLWERVKANFPDLPKPWSVNVTPVLGTHLGPKVVGFALVQKEN